ncbi:2-oxo acid dehydrogenase subunit E2 [Nitriliruptoraceae bacterium ZYF776]|nr:2-oxo acid dehydrogenase subunit E2 [Profundirhabdus halotolerans]
MSTVKEFKLPDLGEGLEEGDIVAWRVEVGDVIDLNQTVAEIETAKAVVEVPSPFAGRVVERIGEVGETLEVGSVFLRIETDVSGAGDAPRSGEDGATATAAGPGGSPADVEVTDAVPEAAPKSTGLDADSEPQPLVGYGQREGGGRRRRRGGAAAAAAATDGGGPAPVLAKPPVRKLAKDLGVELAALAPGSGPDGVITREDVRAASSGAPVAPAPAATPTPAPAPTPAPSAAAPPAGTTTQAPSGFGFRGRAPGDVEPVRGIRKRIVEKMETSRRTVPEATCSRWADVTDLWAMRRDLTAAAAADGFAVKVTPFAIVLRAVVVALRRFPTVNASMVGRGDGSDGEIHLHEPIHLGFAADTDRGLVVPVIKDAHTLSTLQIAAELNRLATAARDGSITASELTGGTFTVSNYGAFGNDDGDPVINTPEGALLGVGAMRERPWVVPSRSGDPDASGELAVRRTCKFTLAFDHRLSDGGEAGRFVTYVGDLCEQPSRLLLHA